MTPFSWLSIRWQLLLLVLMLGVPFFAFVLISSWVQADDDRRVAGRHLLDVARLAAARLDDHVSDVQQVLAVLAQLAGTTANERARNDAVLRSLLPRLPSQVSNIAIWTPQGQNIGAVQHGAGDDVDDSSDRAMLDRALASPELQVQAPLRSAVDGRAVAVFALRIERDGGVAGVVTVTTELRALQTLLAPAGTLPEGAIVSVTEPGGVVVARSADADAWIGRKLTPTATLADTLRRGEGVRDAPSLDGVRRLAGFTTAKRVPWLAVAWMPEALALAPARQRLQQTMAAGAAMLLLGLLLSAWIARRISLPLRALQGDAQRLGQGDLAHRSAVRGAGEIGLLARTLNQMAGELQQRSQALHDNRQELAELYAHAPCGFHSLDDQGRFTRINDTALRWMGHAREDVLGRSVLDFLLPEGQALFLNKLPLLLQHGQMKDLEFDLVCKSGAVRRMVASAKVLRDAGGAFMVTHTAMYDITELQRLRGDFQRLSDEQQALLATDLIGIVKLVDRHFAWTNPGALHMLGYSADELQGEPSQRVCPDPVTHAAVDAALDAAAAAPPGDRRTFRTQVRLLRKDGTLIWVDMMATVLPARPDAVIVMLVDITPLKDAEDSMVRALALEAQNHHLLEADRIKSLFLANMSHELHTPLHAVLGFVQLLRGGHVQPDSPKFASFLQQIETSGRQLLAQIDAMLLFAKAESNRLDLRPGPVSLQALLTQVLRLLQPAASKRGLTVQLQVAPDCDAVVVDAKLLTQVVSILLSNAIKFSPPDALVQVRVRGAPDDMFCVEVEDQGIGIAAQDLPRLFTAFQQLSEGATKAFPGLGLGLALARRIAQAQGGSVTVRSTPGVGSVFALQLPRGPASAAALEGDAGSSNGSGGSHA